LKGSLNERYLIIKGVNDSHQIEETNVKKGKCMLRRIIEFICLMFFMGCGQYSQYFFKSYELNKIKSVTVGSPMITVETGSRWERMGKTETSSLFSRELIYSGVANGIIHISYREYAYNIARPAFYQDLQYEYKPEMLMMFQDYILKIYEANSEWIKFAVINEPVRSSIEKQTSPQPDTIRVNKM
jgi:hypothetical protein